MTAYSERVRGTSVHIIEQLRAEMAHREAQAAQRIQAGLVMQEIALLPERREVECAARLRAAREVGGDFYDAFFVDAHRLFVTVGRAGGKGLPGALAMLRVLTCLRREAPRAALPRLLEHLNRQLFEAGDAEAPVALFCAVLDTATGALETSSAGPLPAALARGEEPFERLELQRNPVVGVVGEAAFAAAATRLPPGSVLALATEGVVRAQSWSRETFGEAGLLDALNGAEDRRAAALADSTIAAIDGFVGDAPQSDDITFLALRYCGPARA
jgi:serine phosphatase RsbU (regulator of sigma subunit)